jgi:hypothetical protein
MKMGLHPADGVGSELRRNDHYVREWVTAGVVAGVMAGGWLLRRKRASDVATKI